MYCIRKNKCRFKFPRNLSETTHLALVEKKYSSSSRIARDHEGTQTPVRSRSIEIIAGTNDRWLNGHSRPFLEAWGANCDFTLLVDFDAVLNYVAKYSTKTEQNSRGFRAVFYNAIRKANETQSTGNQTLRSIFLRSSAGREKTQQETSHLLLSLPMTKCSHEFTTVNLYNNMRVLEEENDEI
jgi:hypothetical protein